MKIFKNKRVLVALFVTKIAIGLLIGGYFLIYLGRSVTYRDEALEVKYRAWKLSKQENGVSSSSGWRKVAYEIFRQRSENLPPEIWKDKVVAEIELNADLKKETESRDGAFSVILFKGQINRVEAKAETRMFLAGEYVYALTFASAVEKEGDNEKLKQDFFGSIEILKEPEIASFDITGSVIKKLSDTRILVATIQGEAVNMTIAAGAKIFKLDQPFDPKNITAEMRFGAVGERKGAEFTATKVVFIE